MLRCIFVRNLEIVTSIGGELWHAQAQNGVNFDFGVQFDLEGQDQSSHKTIVIRWRPSQKRQAASIADVPRVTSSVSGAPESSRGRALTAHAGLAIRQPPCSITRDIVVNRQQKLSNSSPHTQ